MSAPSSVPSALTTPSSNVASSAVTALEILQNTFGYQAFRGQQQDIIDTVVAGKDALVIMPTGGGKSLCYQIPAILRAGCGVIISPLIALMQNQVDALRQLGVNCHYLNSSQTLEENQAVEQALLSGGCQLLYIAPERLLQARTLALLEQSRIALFAIDEAHCVSQWGHDFRADYLHLDILAERFARVPRIALTATADARTQTEIVTRLQLTQAQHFIAGFDRPNITYHIELKNQPKQQLLLFLQNEHANDSGIVYCLSRKKTEATALWLQEQGFRALPYHAGLSAAMREQHQNIFLKEEKVIIVATIAFGMGIDKPDVRFVVHLDLPKSIEAYYQETGRAGRDGEAANAWMVYGLEDVIKLREMMAQNQVTTANEQYKRIESQKLDAMLGLCEITTCRRVALLHYFGETGQTPCGNCDNCLKPVDVWDGTEVARKAISCAYRTEQRFGVSHLIDVLRGGDTEKVRQFNHHHLSVYGIGKDLDKKQWRSVFRQLIARGLLLIDYQRYNAVVLSESCRPLLQGKETIDLRKDPSRPERVKRHGKDQFFETKKQYGALWDALRQCRSDLAKDQGVPPYLIFHDSTLMEMAEKRPQNREAFSKLSGVGIKKQEQYADAFLAVIAEHQSESDESTLSATLQSTLDFIKQDLSLDATAEQRNLSLATIYTHASELIYRRLISLDAVVTLSEADIEKIKSCMIDNDLMDIHSRLKPAYEALGEVYDYAVLRCVHRHLLAELGSLNDTQ